VESQSNNYDSFLQELGRSCYSRLKSFRTYPGTGIGVIKRYLAQSMKRDRHIAKDGDGWKVEEESALKKREWTFTLGEEFELVRIDDIKRKCRVTVDNKKWTEAWTPLDSGKVITAVYEFTVVKNR
jgi:hypothetical protein